MKRLEEIKGIAKRFLFKNSFMSTLRNILAVIGAVLIIHSFFVNSVQSAACCSAVRVVNFPELVSMQWVKLFTEQFKRELSEWLKAGLGKLTNTDVFQYFFKDYYRYYTDVYNQVKNVIERGNPQDWVRAYRDGGYLTPSTLWALQPENFDEFDKQVTNYVKYIVLRQKYLETVLNDKKFDLLPQFEKDALILSVRNQESKRDALMKDIISSAASLKLAQNVKEQLYKNFNLSSIDNATDKQAIKDLVKLQIMNAQLLSELIKVISEERLYNAASRVDEINEKDQYIRGVIQEKLSYYEKLRK